MIVNVRHPVLADGWLSGGRYKTIVGTMTTPVEIEEVDASDMQPVFAMDGHPTVHAHGGRCYVEDGEAWREGETVEPYRLGFMSDTENYREQFKSLFRAVTQKQDRRSLSPTFLKRWSTNADPDALFGYFEAAGEFEARAERFEDADIEPWRTMATRLFGNFRISGEKRFLRCHEPLLAAVPGRVLLSSAALFGFDVDALGNPGANLHLPEEATRPDLHVFPVAALEEAEAMAGRLKAPGGDRFARSFPLLRMETAIPLSTEEELVDREAVRFLRLHHAFSRRIEYNREGSRASDPLTPYVDLCLESQPAVRDYHLQGYRDDRDVAWFRQALGDAVAAMEAAGVGRRSFGDGVDNEGARRLLENSHIVLERVDNVPIRVSTVEPGARPR